MNTSREDDDLLARLNALKTTPVTFKRAQVGITDDGVEHGSTDKPPEDDLSSRFLKLHGNSRAEPKNKIDIAPDAADIEHSPDGHGSPTLDELLQELNENREWELDAGEEEKSRDLLAEARLAIQQLRNDEKQNVCQPTEEQAAETNAADSQRSEDEQAHEYIRRALEESALDDGNRNDEHSSNIDNEAKASEDEQGEEQDEGADLTESLNLPAAPTDLPTISSTNLTLPDAPAVFPIRKSKISSSFEKFTDEEMDDWCIICNDDATVKCLGCDGDLYCRNCWREGHEGEDVGYEERRHRAVAFVKKSKRKPVLA